MLIILVLHTASFLFFYFVFRSPPYFALILTLFPYTSPFRSSGSLVRVLEAWTPQPRPVHLLWRQDRRPLPKLTQFIAHLQQGMADTLTTTRASE
uniref:LysR substrate-binding domain-containing protein n=1 Tax=Klebsiella pneumoniae TaxID=573 RepID=UPI003970AD2F